MPAEKTHAGGPLEGRRIVVTRSREVSAALAAPLRAAGAEVIALPTIAIADPEDWGPVDRAIESLGEYDWTVLTSANAVDRFVGRIESGGRRADELRKTSVAAVGSATARRLRERGIGVAFVPADYRAEGLIEEFERRGVGPGCKVLVPRALEAREILPDTLRERGCEVDVVPVYRTVRGEGDASALARVSAGEVDLVTFTSPSTFVHFLAIVTDAGIDADTVMASVLAASIGPVTSEEIRRRGYEVAAEAQESTVEGLAEAVIECLRSGPRGV